MQEQTVRLTYKQFDKLKHCPRLGFSIYRDKDKNIFELVEVEQDNKIVILVMQQQTDIITQQCECCHHWVNQMELVWDLEEDRLVCKECYKKEER